MSTGSTMQVSKNRMCILLPIQEQQIDGHIYMATK